MNYFQRYVSNTAAGSGNQLFFRNPDPEKLLVGRVYYKLTAGGEYEYSFLFSNLLDSTYDHGDIGVRNMICDAWKLCSVRVGVTADCVPEHSESRDFSELTFGNSASREVAPGEFFTSDPIRLSAEKGAYLCLEYSFCGAQIPYHEERIIPAFRLENGVWVDSSQVPFVGMVGCNRPVRCRIAFWGDSITQGIGTERNSYDHWNARLAEMLGDEYSYWNLGLGFGRAEDAASLGAWFFKARQVDLAVVCFGVNDLIQTGDTEQIKKNLKKIVSALKQAGVKVLLQTVPPFDYNEDLTQKWHEVNRYLREELCQEADAWFDAAALLQKDAAHPQLAKYGGHPDAEG